MEQLGKRQAIPIPARRFQAAVPGPPGPVGPAGPAGPPGPPAPVMTAVLNLPGPVGVREHYETVVDASVLPTSRVLVFLAGTTDADENSNEMLDLATIAANPGTGAFDIVATFHRPCSGPVRVHYQVSQEP